MFKCQFTLRSVHEKSSFALRRTWKKKKRNLWKIKELKVSEDFVCPHRCDFQFKYFVSISFDRNRFTERRISRNRTVKMSHQSKRLTTTICDLNDHVLCEIFQNINDFDLNVVADVCFDFRRNALAVFSRRYKLERFTMNIQQMIRTNRSSTWSLRQLPSVLRNFGPFFHSLGICLDDSIVIRVHSQKIMEKLIQYCATTLKELQLCYIDFTAEIIPKLRPLLSQLQKLELQECRWETKTIASEMLSFCPEMHTLSISCIVSWPVDFVTCRTFSKLESFTARCSNVNNESIENFLQLVPRLKEIKILYCSKITTEIIPTIVKYARQIEKIQLIGNYEDDNFIANGKCLRHLSALKSLEMNCHRKSFSPIINELVDARIPLESLNLIRFSLNRDFISAIAKLENIRKLKLSTTENMKLSDITEIIGNMNELTHLDLTTNSLATDLPVKIIKFAPKLQVFICNGIQRQYLH